MSERVRSSASARVMRPRRTASSIASRRRSVGSITARASTSRSAVIPRATFSSSRRAAVARAALPVRADLDFGCGIGRATLAIGLTLPVGDPLALVGDARLERARGPAAPERGADGLVLGELGLVRGQLPRGDEPGVGAEEQLEQGEVAQLGQLVGRLGAP